MLIEAYHHINKHAAPGIDGVTHAEYGKNLEENVIDLERRLKEKKYHARCVRRKNIPKSPGKTRPIGIPVLEDKLVQWVVREILQALFEPLFHRHSFAYRPKRSARQAVEVLWGELIGKYGTVVEVDIQRFFDSLDQEWMIKMVEKRVNDRAILALIRQWMRAGVMHEDGATEYPEEGTPQGGVISPILANIYLHYALDQWFEVEVKKHSTSDQVLVRYADDFVAAFRYRKDADWFYEQLPKRFAKFGLTLSKEKTRKIRFNRFKKESSEPFTFLGFTFYWGVSRKGNDVVMVHTSGKKIRKTIQNLKEWIKDNRHRSITWIITKLKQKLRGHKNYFGIQGNSGKIEQVVKETVYLLHKWLNRRSQRKSYSWETLDAMLQSFNFYGSSRIGNNGVQLSFLSRLY